MPDPTTRNQRVPLAELREQVRPSLVPHGPLFHYFSAGGPLSDEDVRDYLDEPVAALPPRVKEALPPVNLLLVPFLERNGQGEVVTFEAPAENKSARSVLSRDPAGPMLTFAIDDMEVGAYHYELFHHLAEIVVDQLNDPGALEEYARLLREELKTGMHGEVDDPSWQRKQELRRRGSGARDSKTFREYARQSLIDTLTLYLHGICCDIDVEPGPRQMPSPKLRRRLKLLQGIFPPPEGYAVFPEELDLLESSKGRPAIR